MREFKLVIVKPEKTLFDANAVYCEFVTTEGKMGVKALHEPFMAVLKNGTQFLYRLIDDKEVSFEAINAIVTFKKNVCTVILS